MELRLCADDLDKLLSAALLHLIRVRSAIPIGRCDHRRGWSRSPAAATSSSKSIEPATNSRLWRVEELRGGAFSLVKPVSLCHLLIHLSTPGWWLIYLMNECSPITGDSRDPLQTYATRTYTTYDQVSAHTTCCTYCLWSLSFCNYIYLFVMLVGIAEAHTLAF